MLTRAELDRSECGVPGCTNCDHLIYLHAACHLKSALDVAYDKSKGCLAIYCHECGKPVIRVEVAAL